MRRLTIALAVAALAVAACKKKSDKSPASGTAAGPAAGTAAGTAAGPGTAGKRTRPPSDEPMSNKAGNCPSAVRGAATVLADDPDSAGKVILTITASQARATQTIRKRVAHLVEVQHAPDDQIKHTGEGTGGGSGMCPIVTGDGITLTATDIEGGSRVEITPSGSVTYEKLREDVTARIAKTANWAGTNLEPTDSSGGGGGVGGGKGDHGGNHSGKGDGKGKERDQAKDPGSTPTSPGAATQGGGNET